MKNVVGVSRLATSTLVGRSSERMILVMTTPMKMSNPVQVPPVITWTKVSRYRLFPARAAISARGGMTPMAKLQRSSLLVYGGSVEGPGCTGPPDRVTPTSV